MKWKRERQKKKTPQVLIGSLCVGIQLPGQLLAEFRRHVLKSLALFFSDGKREERWFPATGASSSQPARIGIVIFFKMPLPAHNEISFHKGVVSLLVHYTVVRNTRKMWLQHDRA